MFPVGELRKWEEHPPVQPEDLGSPPDEAREEEVVVVQEGRAPR